MVQLAALALLTWVIFVPVYRLAMRAAGHEPPASPWASRHCDTPAVDDLLGVTIPHGLRLEEYVRTGLDDLRIMLVQAARRAERSD